MFNVYLNKKRWTILTNLVTIQQIIIKYDNATYIFTKASKNDVLKIEIFLPLDMAVWFICSCKFSKDDEI